MPLPIERRVSALEKQATPDNKIKTVTWTVVDPGRLDAEMVYVRADSGETWHRLPGETEDELLERAAVEVTRDAQGCARLIADSVTSRPNGLEERHARA